MSLAENARLFYCLNLAVLITAFLLPEFSRFDNGFFYLHFSLAVLITAFFICIFL